MLALYHYSCTFTKKSSFLFLRHHELLEQEGLYFKMWNQQLQDENQPESPKSDKKND